MANASTRAWIQWPPEVACEPTSTLVLSSGSPENFFVDIRVKTPGNSQLVKGPNLALKFVSIQTSSLDLLDWAFAGVSERIEFHAEQEQGFQDCVSEQPFAKGRWHHQIDSKTRIDEEPIEDVGDLHYYVSRGTNDIAVTEGAHFELEKGQMLNPDTGKTQSYEELWASIDAGELDNRQSREQHQEEVMRCMVLKASHDEGERSRGMVILVGKWWQGVLRRGQDFVAERWQKTGLKEWECLVKIGKGQLPAPTVLEELKLDSKLPKIVVGDVTWVIEVSR